MQDKLTKFLNWVQYLSRILFHLCMLILKDNFFIKIINLFIHYFIVFVIGFFINLCCWLYITMVWVPLAWVSLWHKYPQWYGLSYEVEGLIVANLTLSGALSSTLSSFLGTPMAWVPLWHKYPPMAWVPPSPYCMASWLKLRV